MGTSHATAAAHRSCALLRSGAGRTEADGGLVRASAAAVASDASGGSGGDWYDMVALAGGGLAAVVGDVTGHGQQAAHRRQAVRTALRRSILRGTRHSDVLPVLRDRVRLPPDGLATVLYAAIDPGAGVVTFANAGHLPPLMVSPRGQTRFVSDDALQPPIGAPLAATSRDREPSTIACEPGTTVVLYTDGLVESPLEDVDHGLARLAATVHHDIDLAPHELCRNLLHCGARRRTSDDRTALVVRMPPSGL